MALRRTTVRDFVYYEYAKLITRSAKGPRPENSASRKEQGDWWGFVVLMYKKLHRGDIQPSKIDRENKQLVQAENRCAYCGASGALQWEHIIPKSRGGPDTIDNLVLACGPCNGAKCDKDPIEWYSPKKRIVPPLVMGKLLKLVLERNAELGTLDSPLARAPDGRENWIAAFEPERAFSDCPFCGIADEAVLAQDELTVTIRDSFPASPGHSLVIPRRHVASFFVLTAEEQAALLRAVEEVRKALEEEFHPGGYNVGVNVGIPAGQTVWHAHVHVIPRFEGDMEDPRGGVRHCVAGKGYYEV